MKRRSVWVLSLGALALIGGGGYHYLSGKMATPAPGHSAKAATPNAPRAVAVEARRVDVDTVIEDIRAVGTLRANEAVVISPEVAGRIARIRFDEGTKVEAGEVLVELDAAILQAELKKAQSDLTLARANHDRAATLARQGIGTLRARDEAAAALRAAEANVALAQARLEKASIAAPFSGVVGLRTVSVGAYVTPGEQIVALADIDPVKVEFRVPELALPSLRTGQLIRVTVDALPGRTFEGKIYAIDPVVDANGRAVRLRALIPNPKYELSPGLFARVRIVVERRENAVLVPESAVFAEGSNRYVYRLVEGRAVLTQVDLGQRQPGQVEVRGGLQNDAVVIVAGQQRVRDGARVEVVKAGAGG